MNLDRLRCFCAVVEQGSFTKAAEQLFCSQPAISKQIAALERELGYALFDRVGRKRELNGNGRIVYQAGKRVEYELAQMNRLLTEANAARSDTVRFGATNYIGVYVVPGLISTFKQRHPQIPVHFAVDFLPNIIAQLDEGEIDFAFVPQSHSVLHNPSYACASFCRDEMVLVYPRDSAIREMDEVDTGVLRDFPFLVSQQKSATREYIEQQLREIGLELRHTVDLYSTEAIKQGIINGMGISILSAQSVRNEVTHGVLRAARLRDLPLYRTLYVVYRRDRPPGERGRLFVELARAQVS